MEQLTSIKDALKQYSWFSDANLDQYGKIVVFVNSISREINSLIPESINRTQVLVHFSTEILNSKDKYCNILSDFKGIQPIYLKKLSVTPADTLNDDAFLDVDFLKSEIKRLQNLHGESVVEDLFYELHDQSNALTDISKSFPYEAKIMEKLYNNFGFDVIYEIL